MQPRKEGGTINMKWLIYDFYSTLPVAFCPWCCVKSYSWSFLPEWEQCILTWCCWCSLMLSLRHRRVRYITRAASFSDTLSPHSNQFTRRWSGLCLFLVQQWMFSELFTGVSVVVNASQWNSTANCWRCWQQYSWNALHKTCEKK